MEARCSDRYDRLFPERRAIALARAHAYLELYRRAKNCLTNKQQIARLDCFYFLQAQLMKKKKEKYKLMT